MKKALQKSGSREIFRNALAALGDATLNERLDYFTDKFLNNYLDGLSGGAQANTPLKDGPRSSQRRTVPLQTESTPGVQSTNPARSAVGVKIGLTKIEVAFDEPIQAGSLSIAMTDAGNGIINLNNIAVQGNNLTATLASLLKPRSVYRIVLRAGAIRNSLGIANEEYQWTFTSEPPAPAIGSSVQVSNTGGAGFNLRSSPSLVSTDNILGNLPEGVRLRITGGPQESEGYTWWNVLWNGQAGWFATGKWLVPTDESGLRIGAQVTIANTSGMGLPLREEPGNSGVITTQLSEGTLLMILSGPYLVDGYAWWSVKSDIGTGFCPTADWLVADIFGTSILSSLTVMSSSPNAGAIIMVSPADVNGLANGTTQFQRFYSSNTSVSLTAPATSGGSSFEKWQRNNVDWSTNLTTDVTMDASHTMTAVYRAGPALALSSASYDVNEGASRIDISVVRSGDTTGNVSVNYATSDAKGLANCNMMNGNASSRCDYIGALGTVHFASGETSKIVSIFITNDSYSEGPETFSVVLSSPLGAALSAQSTATITINDDDPANGTNPIEAAGFFVDEHYEDFLGRLADASGRAFWTSQITACGNDAGCIEVRRIDVSASFFLSIEFQDTGYLVERIYKTAYGDADGTSTFGGAHTLKVPIVRLDEFLADSQQIGQGVVVLQSGWEQALENNKNAFAAAFVQRSRFISGFPTTMTPAEFVDRLFMNAGITSSAADRNAAIAEFGSATNTGDIAARGRVLRRVAENGVLKVVEFNRAFVLMQYFGYLRRNPNDPQDSDYTGFDFWLTKLNQFNGNYIQAEMVKAFLSSIEYRQRFGPVASTAATNDAVFINQSAGRLLSPRTFSRQSDQR